MMINPEDQIDPRLESLLDELRDVPARDPQRAARGRAQFLSQAVAIREQAVSRGPIARLREWLDKITQPKEFKMTTLITILTIVGLLAGGGAGTVYAAQDSLPNEALYGIKIASENVQLQLAGDAQQEFALHLEYAQRRSDEIAALLDEGLIPSEEVMLRLQAEMQAAIQLANGMQDAVMTQAMQQTESMLQNQMQTMTQLQQNASPDVSAMLEETRSMLENQLMLAQGMSGDNHPEGQTPGEGFGPGMGDGTPPAEFAPDAGYGPGMGEGTPDAGMNFDSGMGDGTPGAGMDDGSSGMGGGTPGSGMGGGTSGSGMGGGMSGAGN